MRVGAAVALVMLATACSETGTPDRAEPVPAELREYESDAARCQHTQDRWLMELIARIDAALPADAKGTARFDRMSSHARLDGDGQELLLRFTAQRQGEEGVRMFAVAPFDPQTCEVGKMKGSVGRNMYQDAGKFGFEVP